MEAHFQSPMHATAAASSSVGARSIEASQSFQASDSSTRGFNDDPEHAKASKWLHHAAEFGDLDQIQTVLTSVGSDERNLLLNLVINGELPLHCAARGGHVEILDLLLPEDLPQLSNAPCKNGGWSPLHFAAAYGHAHVVQWLHISRMADIDMQDDEGNTPIHLAVPLGHKNVVQYLVLVAGSDISILNQDKMMPVSFCSDTSMFEALLPAYLAGSASLNRAGKDHCGTWVLDDDGRNILHYAAQFSTDPNALYKLIMQFGPHYRDSSKYTEVDSFLHVAARSGNMHILQALERLGSVRPDIPELISNSGRNPHFSPALYALLHNHRDFFDKITTMSKDVGITLKCIINALTDELKNDRLIRKRLVLFARTLPTYLALYAKKECIFDFLLETKLISVTQWDSAHNRTCLHWAVLDKRADIIHKLCQDPQVRPGMQDGDGKTAVQHAFEQNNQMVMDIMRTRPDFKEYEEKLYRDRDVYVQALNAILVGAALIASVAFAGWLQWPSTAEFKDLAMKIYWASNSTSFFTAVATMCVTTSALIPTPHRYMGDIVKRLQFAIVMDAGLLALSIAAATCAFAAMGFAAIESLISAYHTIMSITTAVAGCLAIIMWLSFVKQVCQCAPSRSTVLLSLVSPQRRWLPEMLRRPGRLAKSSTSNPGYRSLTGRELQALMDKDLVSLIKPETSNQKSRDGTDVTRREAAASHIRAKFGPRQLSHQSRSVQVPSTALPEAYDQGSSHPSYLPSDDQQ